MRKRRVIIFEDDPAVLNLLEMFFTKRGYEVLSFPEPTACPSYHTQVENCSQEHRCADVLLTDLMMPRMTGIELLERQLQRGCKLDIRNKAVITGKTDNETARKVRELGCTYFKKPFRLSDISKWLDVCEQRMDLSEPVAEL